MAAISLKASQQALDNLIDPARIRKRWNQHDQQWADAADVSLKTLQRFWDREPIRRANFIAICQAIDIEDWQKIADLAATNNRTISTLPPLPGIYQAATWVERLSLTETLLPMLQSDRRVIVLTGMTGIGKTALAERLTLPLQDGKFLRRLNLDDGGITPDFATSGAALLRALGEEPTLDDQKDATNLLGHLLRLLRSRSHRIQIDSLERLLEGDDRQGWSEFCDPLWLDLWQQVLAGGECQSQIILTTQDVPGELEAIGSRYPQLWHCQPIRGLSEAEQLQLFQQHGIVAACNDTVKADNAIVTTHNAIAEDQHANITAHNHNAEADNAIAEVQHRIVTAQNDTEANSAVSLLKRIGKLYEGHPLVLRVIAEDLKTCGGDVQRYWQQCRFAELEANRPTKFSRRKLQLQVNQRVRDSLQRLPDDARHLLCRSAVYRRPVPESFWLALLPERTEDQQQAALNLLKARTFAEEDWKPGAWSGAEDEIPLKQHNLIRSVAYNLLKADLTWETAERQAAHQWLTFYQPAPDVPNLEKIRSYLEAFYHYCELNDWESADEIYTRQVGVNQQEFYWQLYIWGYYKELIQASSNLAGKTTSQSNGICLNQLGNAYRSLGKFKESIEYYQQALIFAREIGDRYGEGHALGNLGIVYKNISNYKQAIDYSEKYLLIAREIGDRQGEGNALGSLGLAYYDLGNYEQAINYTKKDLVIAREFGHRQAEGQALGNLGIAYYSLGNYEQAIECYQQGLAIAREFGNRRGEATALGNLGIAYGDLGNYEQAIECHQQRLVIARGIGQRQGEGQALCNLGAAYFGLGNYEQANEYTQSYLLIAREIGDRQGEAIALVNLGCNHCALDNYPEAIELQNKGLAIAREIGDRSTESYALSGLGGAFIKLEQYAEALEALQAALMICRNTGERILEAEVLKQLAELHQKTGPIDLAQQYCDRALGLAIELGIPLAEECETLKREFEEKQNDSNH